MLFAVGACALLLLPAAHDGAGGTWEPVTNGRVDKGYPELRWQTSFDEFKIGRHAPVNSQACVGVMGWPVMQFGHSMHLRYSEFEMRFRIERQGKGISPYTIPGFRQKALDGYLPAVVTEFDEAGIHYQITYMMAPTKSQPVDVVEIAATNPGTSPVTASLVVNLDGAPTLKASGDLIEDRGKPLIVIDGHPDEVRPIERPIGLVDPRCTAAGAWGSDPTRCWRDGFYGMPIEYMIKVEPGKEYPVYLGTDGFPGWICFGYPYDKNERSVILSVEGDQPRRIDLNKPRTTDPRAHAFVGKDTDGDGYIKISSRATPESRQPAILNAIWVFEPGTAGIKEADLVARKPAVPPKYYVTVGATAPTEWHDVLCGEDPTWKSLSLRYTPTLRPGETKRYALKLPAVDRLELMPYGNGYRPYDTRQSWMRNAEPRHPENKTPYGEDVPPGTDPADYAVFGPKPRSLWAEQLELAREITPERARKDIKSYWDAFLSRRAAFDLPDKDLDDLYKAQLVTLACYFLKWADHDVYTQMCGPFVYWDLCYRDGSYEIRAWDMAGYSDIAGKLCDSLMIPKSKVPVSRWEFGQWDNQENPGMWLTRPGQWDGQGQTLGALVDHYLFTQDKRYLEASYSSLAKGARWIELARKRQKGRVKDPNSMTYGLYPSGELEAGGSGNPYYINAYGVYGLRQVARTAAAIGKSADEQEFLAEADEFAKAIKRAARERFVRFNDYCGTLSVAPEDQNNLGTWPASSLVYPLELYDAFDPVIDGYFRFREAEAAEGGGLMGFPYIYSDWAISYIRRGQPDRTVDLFNSYVDTASEMMGWSEGQELYHKYNEFDPPKVGVRGAGDMPHGEGCSNYIIMLRNLLLHEEGDTLRIAPATPRRWMAQGKPFGAKNAPTYFGKVTFSVKPDAKTGTVSASVKLAGDKRPKKVLLHLRTPDGCGLKSVEIGGKPWGAFYGDTIVVANPPREFAVRAAWR